MNEGHDTFNYDLLIHQEVITLDLCFPDSFLYTTQIQFP